MKKQISLLLVVMIIVCTSIGGMSQNVFAVSVSADTAISWVNSQVGKSIDADGVYGAQCVDLIRAYYSYLGVSQVGGNGKDYATNEVPSGWSRIAGATPQKGDVLVYSASSSNTYGHVAIFESESVTYHQNFSGAYVEKVTNIKYNGFTNPYWGVIRPNWSGGSSDGGGSSTNPDDPVYVSTISNPQELDNLIDSDVQYSSQDTVGYSPLIKSGVHKITVNKPGWIFLKVFGENGGVHVNLYTNAALASKISEGKTGGFGDSDDCLISAYVEKGTYYYQSVGWFGYGNIKSTVYAGFMPSSKRISVKSIKYAPDKTYATVTFNYDTDYLNGFLNGTIRVVKKKMSRTQIQDGDFWEVSDRKNALTKNSVKITKNGTYTARIAGGDNYFCATSFVVKGLVAKPAATAISSAKPGKKQMTVRWKKVTGANGYQLEYAKNSKFTSNKKTINIANPNTVNRTVKKLTSGKKYYVRVRTYKKVNGYTIYSSWSKTKVVKVK